MRSFKFFDEKSVDEMNIVVGLPIGPGMEGNYQILTYFTYEPNYTSAHILFEWVRNYDYRELRISRLVTYAGDIVDFSRWYDLKMRTLSPNEYLPNYPPIYRISTNWNRDVFYHGDVQIPSNNPLVEIDVKIYLMR